MFHVSQVFVSAAALITYSHYIITLFCMSGVGPTSVARVEDRRSL